MKEQDDPRLLAFTAVLLIVLGDIFGYSLPDAKSYEGIAGTVALFIGVLLALFMARTLFNWRKDVREMQEWNARREVKKWLEER